MSVKLLISRRWWDARRFGVSPDKWRARLTNQGQPRIFCTSIPKAGTHLLERALCLHPRIYRRILPTINHRRIRRHGGLSKLLSTLGPGEIVVAHCAYSEENDDTLRRNGARCFFMIRDPRDIVISYVIHLLNDRKNPHHRFLLDLPDMRTRILLVIKGYPPVRLPSIQGLLSRYYGWFSSGALVVRFEDLVGAAGGGSDDVQFTTVQTIYEHLGMPLAHHEIKQLTTHIFSNQSPTFRKGLVGKWREYFDDQAIQLFTDVASDMLVRYGYDNDDRW
ncbi:MAG: sulfotransferase domain-containing protein [Nitrococcus sp.]|nr:sulfotransferase domain-containing protein [Nitrococcus sp.]